MTRKLKPIELPIDPALAQEVLNFPVIGSEGEVTTTIGERLREAVAAMAEANAFLAESAVANLLAHTLMKDQKRRGFPSLQVSPDGEVVLRIDYEGEAAAPAKPKTLPSLDALREQANAAGVDISDLGRKKHEIIKRLNESGGPPEEGVPPSRLRDEVTESVVSISKIKLPSR